MIATRSYLTCLLAAGACFWLAHCVNADSASTRTVFDFAGPADAPIWQVVNDDVMGGVSSSQFSVINGVALFRGEVSLENNGGFASVRSLPSRHDFSGSDAFLIRVRGDGRRYKFTTRTDRSFDGPMYQASFLTKKGEWEELRLPMKDFVPTFRGRVLPDQPPLDPAKVTSVGFLVSDKQAGPFQLEVAWIKVRGLKSPE
jgi:NADH dehydrogenase [ubiquinone] 1 alpha subcomplex assembly factor 1